MMFSRITLLLAAVAGMSAVALGAFGAHALRSQLSERQLEVWQTAVQYQFWHALALLVLAVLLLHDSSRWLRAALFAFVGGILCFSGSLYAMVLTGHASLGMITPIGGVALMIGWLLLGLSALRFTVRQEH